MMTVIAFEKDPAWCQQHLNLKDWDFTRSGKRKDPDPVNQYPLVKFKNKIYTTSLALLSLLYPLQPSSSFSHDVLF